MTASDSKPGSTARAPVVSVVIPTFQRPGPLRACLLGLVAQALPHDLFEAVVVDDGGIATAAPVAEEFVERLAIRVIRTSRTGPGAARNAGAGVARGRFLAFIDDDCVPDPQWLSTLLEHLERNDSALLGGRIENGLPANIFAAANQAIASFVYDYYRSPGARERFFTTNNIGLAAVRFRSVGGFTTAIRSLTAEDKEFCDRWTATGLPLVQVPGAVVHHYQQLTLRMFVRQHYRYGRGILAFRLLRRERSRGPLVPEPAGFYARLVTDPVSRGGPGGIAVVSLILLAQAATLAGALAEALLANRRNRMATVDSVEAPSGTDAASGHSD